MKNIIFNLKKIINNQKVLALIMSSITYYSLCINNYVKAYDPISWLIYFALIALYLKTKIFNKELKKEIIFFSLLFSFILVFGNIAYTLQYDNQISVFRTFLTKDKLLELLGLFNFIFILLTNLFPKLYNYSIKKNENKIKSSKIVFIICLTTMLLAWLPYLLSFFPGVLTPDSISELGTVINNFTNLSNHHPIIHTIFIAIPYNIGFKITESVSFGVALATITQMITLASIFSYFITFLYKRKINDYVLLIILLIYSLVPMHGYYSITMWKDVIFAGCILLLTIETIKIIEKDINNKISLKNLVNFILISILTIFFRNNAIYMYILFAIFTILVFRNHFKQFITAFLIVFSIFIIVNGPIFNYFNVTKSSSSEYIAIPLQQISRMAFKNVAFTEEESDLLNKLIPIEIMREKYNPKLSDDIKFNKNYNRKVFDLNKFDYFKLWLQLVIKHPTVAVESYAISTLGYWYPGVEYWSVSKVITENDFSLEMSPKISPEISQFITELEYRDVPIISIEWSIGLCFWIILVFGMISFKKYKLKGIYPFIPVLGIWITMMIASPVYAEFRYVYCAYTTLPLLVLIPYLNIKETTKKYKNNNRIKMEEV